MDTDQQLEAFGQQFQALRDAIGSVVVGHDEIVQDVLTCLVCGEHVLLEGVPGLGKTLLVRTLSQVARVPFSRIQFTPDLMPADIIGTNVVVEDSRGHREFQFQPGPIFASILLADEINRATPKTQSALLEAMQERSVTVAGTTHKLADPFLVLATQNPLEMEGTYPLPEAQLDRFMFKVLMRFPSAEDLDAIVERTTDNRPQAAEAVCGPEELLTMRTFARDLPVARAIREKAVQLVLGTHPESEQVLDIVHRHVRYGASPRGAQSLVLGAKVRAALDGRCHVAWEDIEAMALPALRHRIILNFEAQANQVAPDDILRELIERVGAT